MQELAALSQKAPPTADVCDLIGATASVIRLPWLRFGRKERFAGPAVTFKAESDTALIRPILEETGRGRVLVIDNGGSLERAVFGDKFGNLMVRNGWAGTVINGATRDTEGLAELDVSVFALGVCPIRPLKNGVGERSAYLQFGGVRIRPGDWIVGDADGLIVVPFERLPESGLL